jgi:hypothetical protein
VTESQVFSVVIQSCPVPNGLQSIVKFEPFELMFILRAIYFISVDRFSLGEIPVRGR